MSCARWLLAVGAVSVMACGPGVDPTEPSEGNSTGEPSETTGMEGTEGDAADDAVDGSEDSGGEVIEGWCLESRVLVAEFSPDFTAHADVDGDGLVELWFSEEHEDGRAYNSIGLDANGDFGEITAQGQPQARYHVMTDVDGDGHGDAVSFGTNAQPTVGWFAGQADGTLSNQVQPLVEPRGSWAQLDGDGVADRIRRTPSNQYLVELGVGDGTFIEVGSLEPTHSNGATPYPVRGMAGVFGVRVDDGGIDFAEYSMQIYAFDAEGGFALTHQFPLKNPWLWGLFDVEDDGLVDMAHGGISGQDAELNLARGQFDGTFVDEPLVAPEPGAFDGSAGDFDGDGQVDLLWHRSHDGSVWLAHGIEGGFAAPQPVQTSVEVGTVVVTPADYDGDGRDSWVTRREGGADIHELVRCAE